MAKEGAEKQLREANTLALSLRAQEKLLLQTETSLQQRLDSLESEKSNIANSKELQFSEIKDLRAHLESILQENQPAVNVSKNPPIHHEVDLLISPRGLKPGNHFSLQEKLKHLESKTQPPSEKTALKIDRVKNQLSTMRGEKAIYDSIKTSNALKSKMNRLNTTTEDASQRRKELYKKLVSNPQSEETRKTLHKAATGYEEQYVNLYEIKTQAEILQKQQVVTQKLLDAKRKVLDEREHSLAKKRETLLARWMKQPNAGDLIANLQFAIAELTSERRELDQQRELFLQEKFDLKHQKNKFTVKLKKVTEETNKEKRRLCEEKKDIESVKAHLRKILPTLKIN